jgi:tryptophanyl-tRNA synthetase
VLTLPEGSIPARVAVVPGTDGRKMSKSHGNVVPIFGPRDEVVRRIKAIVTDSRRPDEPKDPASCNVFALLRLVAPADVVADVETRYRAGMIGYREAKELLIAAHERRFGAARGRFHELRADEQFLRKVLVTGAERARPAVRRRVAAARAAVGIVGGEG